MFRLFSIRVHKSFCNVWPHHWNCNDLRSGASIPLEQWYIFHSSPISKHFYQFPPYFCKIYKFLSLPPTHSDHDAFTHHVLHILDASASFLSIKYKTGLFINNWHHHISPYTTSFHRAYTDSSHIQHYLSWQQQQLRKHLKSEMFSQAQAIDSTSPRLPSLWKINLPTWIK